MASLAKTTKKKRSNRDAKLKKNRSRKTKRTLKKLKAEGDLLR